MADPVDDLAKRAAPLLKFRAAFAPPRTSFITPSTQYVMYEDDVAEFFHLLGASDWMDHGYNPRDAQKTVGDPQRCAQADLAEVRAALTYCVRAERFSEGTWNSFLTSGQLQRLLDRLAVLAGEAPDASR